MAAQRLAKKESDPGKGTPPTHTPPFSHELPAPLNSSCFEAQEERCGSDEGHTTLAWVCTPSPNLV